MLGVSDRVKKWAVLLPTEVLPAPMRVPTRETLLRRLELAKAEQAALIIIGHPKSGNTWLRVLLSRIYQVRHGLPASLIVHSDELHRRNPAIPCITATNGWYTYERVVGEVLAAGAPDHPVRHKPIVFLARNPLDIAVSWYIQFTKRQSRQKRELINATLKNPIDPNTISRWDFVRHSEIGLESLIEFLNTWERNVRELERAITIRYEDLRADPATQLRVITDLMGDPASDEEIAEAVNFGSFENMQKLERQGFFRSGGLSLLNPKDPETLKVRRAKVGGYRDYFTDEQAAELEAIVAEKLSPAFGYTPART